MITLSLVLIPQDPAYHLFADQRTLLGVPNFWNVVSNAAFLIAAGCGPFAFRNRAAFIHPWERVAYAVLLAGTALIGVGSGYYHLRPNNATLFWDRLPMAVVFMCLVCITLRERVSPETGRRLLLPMILLGIGSVVYWRLLGDLLPYAIVQFGAMAAIPILLLRYTPRYSSDVWLWATILLYAAAKAAELLDRPIGQIIPTGGHPWKHLAGGMAIAVYAIGVARRRPLRALRIEC